MTSPVCGKRVSGPPLAAACTRTKLPRFQSPKGLGSRPVDANATA
jgi:hypothetical protein